MQQTPQPEENVFDTLKESDFGPVDANYKVARLVKKKKKKAKVTDPLHGYEIRKKQQFSEGDQRVFVDGRTFQQLIESCRKPKRLPPKVISNCEELPQQQEEKSGGAQEAELRFHIPRVDPLKDKTRKRKELFTKDQSEIDEYGQQEVDEIAIQNYNAAIKKELQMRNQLNPSWQQKMLRFLKKKYNQSEPQQKGEFYP